MRSCISTALLPCNRAQVEKLQSEIHCCHFLAFPQTQEKRKSFLRLEFKVGKKDPLEKPASSTHVESNIKNGAELSTLAHIFLT